MSAELWPEEREPFGAVFEREKPPASRGPIATFSLLEMDGLVVWDERKGFWSPAPGKSPDLRLEFEVLLQAGEFRFPCVEDIRQALHCWPFWARFEQLAPGTCPRLTAADREASLAVMERIRRKEAGSSGP